MIESLLIAFLTAFALLSAIGGVLFLLSCLSIVQDDGDDLLSTFDPKKRD